MKSYKQTVEEGKWNKVKYRKNIKLYNFIKIIIINLIQLQKGYWKTRNNYL